MPWFFGEGFGLVVVLLKCLSPIIVVISISNALGYQYYDPSGKRLKSAKYLVVGAVCNLILNCLLIPHLRSVGAVIGSVVSEMVISALYLKNCEGYLKLSDLAKMAWKKLIAGGAMLILLLALSSRLQPIWWQVVLAILAGGSLYILILLLLRDSVIFSAAEKIVEFIKKFFKKRKGTEQ